MVGMATAAAMFNYLDGIRWKSEEKPDRFSSADKRGEDATSLLLRWENGEMQDRLSPWWASSESEPSLFIIIVIRSRVMLLMLEFNLRPLLIMLAKTNFLRPLPAAAFLQA